MEMTLRMPSTYVDIDREEMEYVDGGVAIGTGGSGTAYGIINMSKSDFIYRFNIVYALGVFAIPAYMMVSSYLSNKGTYSGTQLITKSLNFAGVCQELAIGAIKFIGVCSGLTVVNAVATILDKYDKSGENGMIQW